VGGIYTLHGHELRLFEELKAQGYQGVKSRFVGCVSLSQAIDNRGLEGAKDGVVLGP
jgi:hypothetical protein